MGDLDSAELQVELASYCDCAHDVAESRRLCELSESAGELKTALTEGSSSLPRQLHSVSEIDTDRISTASAVFVW